MLRLRIHRLPRLWDSRSWRDRSVEVRRVFECSRAPFEHAVDRRATHAAAGMRASAGLEGSKAVLGLQGQHARRSCTVQAPRFFLPTLVLLPPGVFERFRAMAPPARYPSLV